LRLIIPFIDVLHRISLRIVTMPTQSQGIITRDNVSADVSAVAYVKVVDAVKSVVAIEARAPTSWLAAALRRSCPCEVRNAACSSRGSFMNKRMHGHRGIRRG